MTTPTYKEDQIRPWIAVCPKCGKKSRMRTRDEPKNCFETREKAIAEAVRRTEKESRMERAFQ